MPLYDFECSNCEYVFELFRSLEARSLPAKCPKCGCKSQKLISLPSTHKDLAYSFVDVNTTGKPIQFSSKGQWRSHLKKLGLTDDIPQTKNFSERHLKRQTEDKSYRRDKIKKVVEESYLETKA